MEDFVDHKRKDSLVNDLHKVPYDKFDSGDAQGRHFTMILPGSGTTRTLFIVTFRKRH